MSAISNEKLKYVLVCVVAVWSGLGLCNELLRDEKNSSKYSVACNGSGECSVEITDLSVRLNKACESPRISMSWNKRAENLYLISCDCECTSHDNSGWIVQLDAVDRKPSAKNVPLGRDITIEKLESSSGEIHDIYSSHPMCEPIDRKALRNSIFASLFKQPTTIGANPYCYSVVYIVENNSVPLIFTGNEQLKRYIKEFEVDVVSGREIQEEVERVSGIVRGSKY
ncbi:hypothetical protein [Pseudomonas sp. MF4836]|uniref:hypothetical protein n=1 Tax=Pseudomonas sp. MF4836 TaxID=1960827 RepID=UPI0012908123|nr:hypothetical protein [Pseudomonas sp. MF4836]